MNILFRADSSGEIGLGHVMRDLVLARQYQHDIVIFAAQSLPGNINQKIIDSGYKVVELEDNRIDTLVAVIEEYQIDMVVFDHYGIDEDFEKKVYEKSGVKILSFDDTYERHFCDILLNHNISAREERYSGLVPEYCELRCGEKYTLIRDEFKNIERKTRSSLKSKKLIRVFVSMGGVDTANIAPRIISFFNTLEGFELDIVTTSGNKHIDALRKAVSASQHAHLHIDSGTIAKIMNESDLAIITPSVSVHEALFLDLPFVAIQTADNQQDMVAYLKEHHYKVLEKYDEGLLKTSLCALGINL